MTPRQVQFWFQNRRQRSRKAHRDLEVWMKDPMENTLSSSTLAALGAKGYDAKGGFFLPMKGMNWLEKSNHLGSGAATPPDPMVRLRLLSASPRHLVPPASCKLQAAACTSATSELVCRVNGFRDHFERRLISRCTGGAHQPVAHLHHNGRHISLIMPPVRIHADEGLVNYVKHWETCKW